MWKSNFSLVFVRSDTALVWDVFVKFTKMFTNTQYSSVLYTKVGFISWNGSHQMCTQTQTSAQQKKLIVFWMQPLHTVRIYAKPVSLRSPAFTFIHVSLFVSSDLFVIYPTDWRKPMQMQKIFVQHTPVTRALLPDFEPRIPVYRKLPVFWCHGS